ncbi:CDF membrane [Chlorella sorokiniana]|uniref:CDF membrane n=1 Tax=Chlorella sorokiniana TaxID=3076 RepID=A0A2P6TVC9_CHLSO|nr:CDF membrane [Chlorella sorokiniana]|eukprot:PRW58020.1 CDF membrane [Chlorella sorokiniana]
MADLAQPLLPTTGKGGSSGGSGAVKLPTESPFANGSQQDVEAARPATHKEGGAEDTTDASTAIARKVALAIWLSLFANVLLVVVKAAAYVISGSMAVLASAVDSVIDLLSQFVIWLADWAMARKDDRYPAGKARLEPISVLACAFIMVIGSLLVIQESAEQLWSGLVAGILPELELRPLMFAVLGMATLLKLPLWWYCSRLTRYSGAAEALAEDHINDVWANAGAIVTAAVASRMRQLWWTDPAGGICISALIIYRWSVITASSVAKVVGLVADADVLDLVQELAEEHHPQAKPGFLRAFHAGQRVAVDCELEAHPELTILEAATISRDLKEKMEALPEVESASVIVVPLGTHTGPCGPALLLPPRFSKLPGAADVAEDALLAESQALSRLASAYLAAAPTQSVFDGTQTWEAAAAEACAAAEAAAAAGGAAAAEGGSSGPGPSSSQA